MSNRREAREYVMQALYARELSGDDADHLIATVLKPALEQDSITADFATSLFLRTLDHTAETDRIIADHAQNWNLDRIALIDRILLRMALTEFLYFPDIPPKVSINEAIEVAKKYSTPKSGHFVNGILDAILNELIDQNRLDKSGRGLVGLGPGRKATPPAETPENSH